jgi:hypothetical protein
VRAHLELVARGLVDVRRAQDVEALDARGQRHRATDYGAGALGGIHDLEGRLVDQFVVKRLQADANTLALHFQSFSKSERPAGSVSGSASG